LEGLDPKYVDSLSIEALIYPEKLNFWDKYRHNILTFYQSRDNEIQLIH
jgi:hypothetical protein